MIKMLLGGLFVAAVAAEPPAPPIQPAQEPPSIHRYGDVDATCQKWVDGCRSCDRGSDGAPVCSNIGIACQPQAVECAARKAEPAK